MARRRPRLFRRPDEGIRLMLELILSTLGCGLLCYTLGRYNRTLTLQRWQFVLNAPEQRAIESLREKIELDSVLARQALATADRAREANRIPDALTVLRVALSILEEAGADRLKRLRAMGVYSRMVRAIQPLPTPSAAPWIGSNMVHPFDPGQTPESCLHTAKLAGLSIQMLKRWPVLLM